MSRTSRIARRNFAVWVAVVVAAGLIGVPSTATGALPSKGRTYSRLGERVGPGVSFSVSRGGRTLREIFVDFQEVPCSNGRTVLSSYLTQDPPWRLRVAPDGSFAGTFAVAQEDLESFTASEEYWLAGSFIRRGKAARVVVRARQVGEGGTVCDTGERRVTVRRERREAL